MDTFFDQHEDVEPRETVVERQLLAQWQVVAGPNGHLADLLQGPWFMYEWARVLPPAALRLERAWPVHANA